MENTSFDQCIKCTVCTVYCPVSKHNPDFLGPKTYGPDGERLRRKDPAYYDEMMSACTNCKRCETACPSGVKIGDIIAIARKKHAKKPLSPKTVRDFILGHTDLMGSLSTPFAPIVNAVTDVKPIKSLMHKTLGIHDHKRLPKYARGGTFRRWFNKQRAQQEKFDRQVHYFHGCYVNYNNPQQGKDLVKVLNAMGIGVTLLEKEQCCGVPLIANGFFKKATQNAQRNVSAMTNALQQHSAPILSTSSTCAMTLRDEYPHVLNVDNGAVRDKIHYISRFLLTEFMHGNQPKMKKLNLRVDYHTPCHLEKSGNQLYTIELLRAIPGIHLNILDSQCCGSAGTYGFKAEHYQTSIKIGTPVFDTITENQPDFVITDCETCKWQIEENTPHQAIHPLSLIAMALANDDDSLTDN
ncbi:anaerobic glycerol-3-phosphate dehydrogenase subunit GlpC [Thaumasiovibrio subtropicus]|uniref:anaerobic glycerol-3-phosphate dehydrogenase subunit GlpC n=1 Tax=Thaumasiovibrio subtropicus TaxID=1891207 RepID=UPI000B35118C|nr:anaerobic glycerol-3-phosphate dehydrogenase subunit GlpC [Thaumasiovibrio subtropicus]